MTSPPSPSAPDRPKAELVSIQYLRAAAALGVVVWHAQGQVGLANTTVLQAGIEIFFVISGYVMWLILGERPVSPWVFLKKRLTRVVPLYWVLTTLMVVLLLAAPQFLQSTRFDLAHVVASYLFIAWPNPVEGVGLRPVMIPGWTLNYEMAFYVLLAVGLCLRTAWRAPLVIGVLCLLASLSVLPMPPIAQFYASPFMAELALGIGLAIAMKRVPPSWFAWGGLVFVAGVAVLIYNGSVIDAEAHDRLVLFGLPAAILTAGLIALERTGKLPDIPLLKAIGDASYPLYMIHPVLLSTMAQLWRAAGLTALSPWLYVALSLVVTSAVGWIAHVTLERPLITAFRPRASKAPAMIPETPSVATEDARA
jgi:exopolysaccharide production protein ExoZ